MGSDDGRGGRGKGLILLAAFAAAFDNFLLPPMLVTIAHDFGVSLAVATGAASAYFLTYGLMQLVWGVASERIGRVAVMRLGLGGGAVACVLATAAPGLSFLIGARMLTGAMLASVVPASVTWVGDALPPERRAATIADINAAYAAGTATGTLAGGAMAGLLGWRAGLGLSAALAAATALLLARVARPPPNAGAPSLLSSARVVLRDGWAWVVVLLALVEGAALFGTVTFLSPALVSRQVSPAVAGGVVAVYGAAIILWTRVLKRVAGRWSAAALLALGGTMLLGAHAAAAWGPGIGGILAASLLASGTMAFMHSTLQVWATEVVPGARGLVVALFATALFVGSAASTRGLAGLAGAGAFPRLFGTVAALALPLTLGAVAARLRYARGVARG